MTVWSSPFPCRVPSGWNDPDPFPGPDQTVLLFDSPDWVLQCWGETKSCDGAEFERLEQGYRQLLERRAQGTQLVQPQWSTAEQAPAIDGALASLLVLVLQSNPNALDSYLQLDPTYLQRLWEAQAHPRHLLLQWLQRNTRAFTPSEHPLEQQLSMALAELDQRQAEQQRVETLLEQHMDQQRRTRRLLSSLIQSPSND